MLGFDVIVDNFESDKIYMKMRFENPTSVSTGSEKDILVGTIIDESFFCSADSPMIIERGT